MDVRANAISPTPTRLPQEEETQVPSTVEYDLSEMEPWREYAVILFNDEVHSYEEVVVQLIRALQCTVARAYELMLRVDRSGQAVVSIASKQKAMHIATILAQIDLKVALKQLN